MDKPKSTPVLKVADDDYPEFFTGDAYCLKNEEFFTVKEKKLVVLSTDIGNAWFLSRMAMEPDDMAAIPKRFDFIIVKVASLAPYNSKMAPLTMQVKRFLHYEVNENCKNMLIEICISHKNEQDLRHVEIGNTKYSLLPRKLLIHGSRSYEALFTSIDIDITFHDHNLENCISEVHKHAKHLQEFFRDNVSFVSEVDVELLDDCLRSLKQSKKSLSVVRELMNFSNIREIADKHVVIIANIIMFLLVLKNCEKNMDEIENKYAQKRLFSERIENDGIKFVSAKQFSDFENFSKEQRSDNPIERLFLFWSECFPKDAFEKAYAFFCELKKTPMASKWLFHAVDLDSPITEDNADYPSEPIIRHYDAGACICLDVWSNINTTSKENFIQFHEDLTDKQEISKRTVLKMVCPICPPFVTEPLTWTCYTCKCLIEYCYSGILSCNCGIFVKPSASFRCHNYYHREFHPNAIFRKMNEIINLDKLKALKQINLLLIGQSGVGKSTWINSLGNYFLYSSLKEALKGNVVTLIPGEFTITDDDGQLQRISMGDDDNEETAVGQSSTQACRTYIIYHNGCRIALIDTPGLGDTRGYEQDTINIQNILHHLTSVSEIHAVCFLLLPNETRANASLLYPLKETMCYLHRSVIPNLIFIFTNSRSTSYRIGETFPIVKKVMNEARQNFDIEDKSIVFKFDSESYRFLCATKSKIHFSESLQSAYSESWNYSAAEAKRLFRIASNKNPYKSQKSADLGWARFRMQTVMSAVMDLNSGVTEDSIIEEIDRHRKKIAALESIRYVTVKSLEESPSIPRLVCTHSNCSKVEAGAVNYKTCMENCLVSNNFRTTQNAELRKARVLLNTNCSVCHCRWEHHMVVDFEQNLVDVQTDNENVVAEINLAQKEIYTLEERLADLQSGSQKTNRKEALLKFARSLASYLAQHSFFLSNSNVCDYLQFLIHSLEIKADKTELDFIRLTDLQASLNRLNDILDIVNQFQNTNYVSSQFINYMSLKKLQEIEENSGLSLPKESDLNDPLLPEKRLFLD